MLICTGVSEKRGVAIDGLGLDPTRDRKLVRALYALAGEADALERRAAGAESTILDVTGLRRERPLKSDEQYVLCQAKVKKAEAQLAADLFLNAVEAVKKGELES